MTLPIERMVDEACGVTKPGVPSLDYVTEAQDRQSKALLQLADVAEQWWQDKMPVADNEQRHLADPTVNCANGAEAKLSRAVASWVVVTRNPLKEQCDDNT